MFKKKKKNISVSEKKLLHKDAKIKRIALSKKIEEIRIKVNEAKIQLDTFEEEKREAVKHERKCKLDYHTALEKEKLKRKNIFSRFLHIIRDKLKKKKKKN